LRRVTREQRESVSEQTETATTFRAGDRVLYPNDPGWLYTVSDATMTISAANKYQPELVQRAHYAPAGTAVLVLTPEVLALFEGIPTMGKHEKIVDAVTAALKADGQQWPSAIAAAQKEAT
jgi:hypothetical protein